MLFFPLALLPARRRDRRPIVVEQRSPLVGSR